MRNIDKYLAIAEKCDWSVDVEESKDRKDIQIDFGIITSQNQDFHMNIYINNDNVDELLHQIYLYWDGFDPEEEALNWIDPHTKKGANGAPVSILDIIKDMQEVKRDILNLYRRIQDGPIDKRDIKTFKKFYDNALEELSEAKIDEESPRTVSLIREYDLQDNYYGNLCFILLGRKKIDVESIYVNENNAMIHVSCEAFDTDIKMANLSIDNIKRVMAFLRKTYQNRLKENNYK